MTMCEFGFVFTCSP